ncbi:hypothetical protein FOZ60_012801 [Perkinsus olseni]|uniref:Eukaryotic translation initiation factor 5B n=1 Tax=Perkinsus olseni TaxID=32597 RepID=A0A7J6P9Y2_PEROL|nr:hypothetical protein FOZ60_012801 [Perkinsus olseni]
MRVRERKDKYNVDEIAGAGHSKMQLISVATESLALLDGAPSGNSSSNDAAFKFLTRVVNDSIKPPGKSSESTLSALSEAELRKMEQPLMGLLCLLGVGAFAPYGMVPGLQLTAPSGRKLALDAKTWLKAWGFDGGKWSRSVWVRLGHRLSLAKLAAPLCICIIVAMLPDDLALQAFELCLVHRVKLSGWASIGIPTVGVEIEEAIMATKTSKWLKDCCKVLDELTELLNRQFEPEDSSVYLERWISLQPSDCSSWTTLCSTERQLYTELDSVHPGACPWSMRLDRLCSFLCQFRRLRDDIGLRSSLLADLKKAKDIVSFDNKLEKWSKDYHPMSLDEVLGVPLSKTHPSNQKKNQKKSSDSGSATSGESSGKESKSVCQYFSKTGKCKYGNKCRYLHAIRSETSEAKAAANKAESGVARTSAVQEPKSPVQSKICREFQRAGKCSYGASCKFSHDEPVLRRSERLKQLEAKKEGSSVATVSATFSSTSVQQELPLVCASVNVSEGFILTRSSESEGYTDRITARVCQDSGSQVNLVLDSFVTRNGLPRADEEKPFSLRGITGDSLKVESVSTLRISLGHRYADVKFGIVHALPHGADILLNHECSKTLQVPLADPSPNRSWESIDDVIKKHASFEWQNLESAPGFSLRLRELQPDEPKECPNQRFCFDVSISPLEGTGVSDSDEHRDNQWPSKVADFGIKLYNRLSPEEQASYDKAVKKFVDSGYWIPTPHETVAEDRSAPRVESFPVKQVDDDGPSKVTSFKVRPVIQAVGVNKIIKAGGARKASYSGEPVADILMGLRTSFSQAGHGDLGLLTLDVGKAFYRFRLSARDGEGSDPVSNMGYIYIKVVNQWYRCNRLAFGLLHGPATLQSGLNVMLRLLHKLDEGLSSLPIHSFYDDILVPIPLHQVGRFLSSIVPLAERIGLVLPPDQIALLSDTAHQVCEIPCAYDWSLRLGYLMKVHQNNLLIRCLIKKRDFVQSFQLCAGETTRRDVSRLTGSAQAGNVLRTHPLRGLTSSALSKLVARVSPNTGWDTPLDLEEGSVHYKHLKHIVDILKGDLLHDDCVHQSVNCVADKIELYCDASQFNYGYHISIGGVPIGSVAKLWPKSAGSWHSNRRELYCLYQGVVHVDDVLRSCAKANRFKSVLCHSDNVGVVGWLRSGCPGCKGVERPAIRRLVHTIKDIVKSWSDDRGINTSFHFVKGSTNSLADELSRLSHTSGIAEALEDGDAEEPAVLVSSISSSDQADAQEVSIDLSDSFIRDVKQQTDRFRHSSESHDEEVWVGESLVSVLLKGVPERLGERLSIQDDEEGVLLSVHLKSLGPRLYIPPDSDDSDLRSQLLRRAHDTAIGHVSIAGMAAALRPIVWWPSIAGDISKFVRNCIGCAREKARHIAPCGYSEVVRSRRWHTIYMDYCGPISDWTYVCPSSHTRITNASILIIIDTMTGWVELCPCADQSAHTASRLLLERWICRYGLPYELRSDRDQAFLSSIQSNICRLLNIEQVFSGGMSPASQGVVESAVRTLKRHLERSFTTDLTLVPWLQRSLNAARKSHAGALPVSAEVLLYGESTKGGLESLLQASTESYPIFDSVKLSDEVRETVAVYCRAWAEDLAVQRAKRVDRLNSDGQLELLKNLSPGDSVFRVTKNGLGRTKATGPFILEEVSGNMVKLSGFSHRIPLHQVRICSITQSGELGCSPDPPDPHGLLAGSRRDLAVGSLILFITPEWEVNDDGYDSELIGKKREKKKAKAAAQKAAHDNEGGKKMSAAAKLAAARLEAARQAEEERKRLEEEAQRKAEEEERLAAERARKEQEEKERKAAEKKARRERLRAEGKLLSKKEKEQRAKADAYRQMLLESGQLPAAAASEEGSTGKPKKQSDLYGKKKSHKHKKQPSHVDAEESVASTPDDDWEKEDSAEESADADKESGSGDESVDDWELLDEDSDDEKIEAYPTHIKNKPQKKQEEVDVKGKYAAADPLAVFDSSDSEFRSPICCIMGHVDTGKTKLLDKIRRTTVQEGEAGGITQQIGATFFPEASLHDAVHKVNLTSRGANVDLKLPGLLIIDTPGHESFNNLRVRGSSLCDIAILVIDIMHGLEPQTIESLELLRNRKCPFIIALNKIDRTLYLSGWAKADLSTMSWSRVLEVTSSRCSADPVSGQGSLVAVFSFSGMFMLYQWRSSANRPSRDSLKAQKDYVKHEFDDRLKRIQLQLAERGLNTAVYWENHDVRRDLTQTLMAKKITKQPDLFQCTVLEVKNIEGLGTTIDVILVNGQIKDTDQIWLPAHATAPAKEIRVKSEYVHHKVINGSMGVKICAPGLEEAVAGTQLIVMRPGDDPEEVKRRAMADYKAVVNEFKRAPEGVYVKASTLGSLEALLDFLKTSDIPVNQVGIGEVHLMDVRKASIMLEKKKEYAVILAFDVKVSPEARDEAEKLGVKIMTAEIIYHLFDQFTAYMQQIKEEKRQQVQEDAVFPVVLNIIPQYVFNKKDPIVVGVDVSEGTLRLNTPLCVPDKEFLEIGRVASIEKDHRPVEKAIKGDSVAIKIQPTSAQAHVTYGRHFDSANALMSRISRRTIDCLKENFREDMRKEDWQLIMRMKPIFGIHWVEEMAIQKRRKKNANNTRGGIVKAKRHTRDIDQIHDDLKAPEKFSNMPVDEDLPGRGQHYCVSCAKYFITDIALVAHFKTAKHRRRLKQALDDPHTQESAEAAVGYGRI